MILKFTKKILFVVYNTKFLILYLINYQLYIYTGFGSLVQCNSEQFLFNYWFEELMVSGFILIKIFETTQFRESQTINKKFRFWRFSVQFFITI